jgi:hypothetical protein
VQVRASERIAEQGVKIAGQPRGVRARTGRGGIVGSGHANKPAGDGAFPPAQVIGPPDLPRPATLTV